MKQLVALVAAAIAAAALAPQTFAAPQRIAYSGAGSKSFGVCTMNSDGTDNVCLQNGWRPAASPTGDLYFVDLHDDTTTDHAAFYRVGADGSNLRLLHYDPFSSGDVSIDVSADGTNVVYARYEGNGPFSTAQIYVANADGSGERKLTTDGGANPSFSPDGTQIVFFGCATAPINNYGNICTIPTAGGTPRAIVAGAGEDPTWGRDGRIAYHDLPTGHVVFVDGNGLNRVDTGIAGAQPALSPDGRQVAFTRMPPLSNVWRIWVANVDGSSQRELTVGERPRWFPGTTRASAAPPTVTVTAPTTGQIVGGKPVTFTWSATGTIASQSIVLEDVDPTLLNGSPGEPQNPDVSSLGFTVVSNLPGDVRSYTWTPPASMNWTDRVVRIAVTDAQGQVGVATAGPVKTRPAPAIPPYVRVAYPSDPTSITWYGGTPNGWTSFVDDDPDGIDRIDVWLSTDSGATFTTLLATQLGWTSIISFPIPNVSTARARVKVVATDPLGNAGSDVGDNDFTIVGQSAPPPPPPPAPAAALASVSLSPGNVVGGVAAQGTVTLDSPAPAGGAAISLTSSSAAASVPAAVTVAAGATSASFTVATTAVSASTPATVAAAYGGLSRSATLTVTAPAADKVSVTRAEYTVSKKELRLEVTASSASATLKAYVTSTGALIGTLANNGGGKYSLQTTWPANPGNVTVRSSLGGSGSATVVAK